MTTAFPPGRGGDERWSDPADTTASDLKMPAWWISDDMFPSDLEMEKAELNQDIANGKLNALVSMQQAAKFKEEIKDMPRLDLEEMCINMHGNFLSLFDAYMQTRNQLAAAVMNSATQSVEEMVESIQEAVSKPGFSGYVHIAYEIPEGMEPEEFEELLENLFDADDEPSGDSEVERAEQDCRFLGQFDLPRDVAHTTIHLPPCRIDLKQMCWASLDGNPVGEKVLWTSDKHCNAWRPYHEHPLYAQCRDENIGGTPHSKGWALYSHLWSRGWGITSQDGSVQYKPGTRFD